jgi:lipopolysaccharide transport system ATP-binding protein
MSTDWAITAEGLGKTYLIRHQTGSSYLALRDVLAERARRAGQRVIHPRGGSTSTDPSREEFWALQDVSFTIRPGERVGIIGRNGAGKSTLLKILSRITDPSAGRLGIRGRVASLLEVGTGFHPELTGRENIYLNGAVLGMSRVDIKRKFDEIVAFAEVEQFLDTPVKRYSSGMYVRLAFAVAAHLEPEILIVDEVLAVGDASFQKKCLGKMKEIGSGKRTIFFVSHNLGAVRSICDRTMVLERGRVVALGPTNPTVDLYVRDVTSAGLVETNFGTPRFDIHDVTITGSESRMMKPFDDMCVSVTITAREEILEPDLYVAVLTSDQDRIAGVHSRDITAWPRLTAGERVTLGFQLESMPLLPGQYHLEIWLSDPANSAFELVPRLFPFEVAQMPVYGGRILDEWHGYIALRATPFIDSRSEAGWEVK